MAIKLIRSGTRHAIVFLALLVLVSGLRAFGPAQAAGTISLAALNSAYSQDFDTLASSGTSSTVPDGWDFSESGTNANTTYTAGTGSGNAGDTYSFGASGSPERAFGGLLSGSLAPTIGASFTNDTGTTINQLSISYTGEQWRLGTADRGPDRLDFQLSTDATSLTTGTWTDYDALDFLGPVTTGALGARDGNAAANRTSISFSITGLEISAGATFWVRWTDFNASGADDGLAVDDFSLTPEFVTTPTDPSGIGTANPSTVTAGDSTLLTVAVTPGANPTSTGLAVTGDLSSIGGSATQPFFDDGSNGDVTAGDNTFTFSATVPGATAPGAKTLPVTITDAQARTANTSISLTVEAPPVGAGEIVISQVYGGGGNSGATYTHDFIELYNRGTTTVSISGWSVQYASAAGSTWQVTPLSGSIAPGKYYLVQEAAGAGGTTPLPAPDATGSIAMSATNGKVALVSNSTALSGTCPVGGAIIDFVGFGSTANCFEGSGPTPTLSNTTAALRLGDGATDTDNNAADFVTGAPNPRNSNFGSDLAPTVASTVPTSGAPEVNVGANITVNFSEPVNVSGEWFTILCTISGAHTATVSGGPQSFTLDPDSDFAGGESCTVTILAGLVSDQDANDPPDNMAADYSWSFTTAAGNVCELGYTEISDIQGSGPATPLNGQTVTTQGVVTGDYEGPSPTLRGFYLQDLEGDGDAATSDGIFVFNGSNDNVSLGQVVRVTGTAEEFQDQTQIGFVSSITDCGEGSVTPVDISLPFPSTGYAERYEGMLVRLPQTLYVSEHFQLGRFGQVVMSSGSRLAQPTNVVAPGAPAQALQAANDLNRIIIDDALNNQNPDPILFGRGGDPLSAANTLRGGDTASGIVGVMTYTWAGNAASGNAYRVRPVNALGGSVPNFTAANPRPAAPGPVGGTLRVAALNLLNYFNTFSGCTNGAGGAPTDCRGAENATEFDRQWQKTVAAIVGLDADVLGVIEIENDGYGPTSAIADLVNRLNNATAPGTYAFIDVDAATGQVNALGTDAIKVGLVYQPASVTPVGATAALNTVAFVNGGDSGPRNRPSLAQAFQQPNGARFIVDVNHFKSKGSACDAPDAGDGQGNCNTVRLNAANELMSWLATDPTGTGDPDVLITGDLNSYAREDPITALVNGGYTNLIATLLGPNAYSFVFDGQWGYLDHALASGSLSSQVTGITEWHINSDEPSVLDYNTNFKSAGQVSSLFSPDQFRVSDHDPVLVGLSLNAPPTVDAGGPYEVVEGGSVTVTATGSDPDGDPLSYAWDLDNDGVFETPGQSATFSAAALAAPSSHTIKVQVSDGISGTAVDEATVFVIYNFSGFFPPVSNPPAFNQVKAGSGVPVRFSLGGDQGLAIFNPGYPQSQPIACDSGAPIDPVDETATPGASSLTYDPLTGQYTYVWRTNRSWAGTCRQLIIQLNDGTTHLANFSFTR